jgi:hypothetical protein
MTDKDNLEQENEAGVEQDETVAEEVVAEEVVAEEAPAEEVLQPVPEL